MAVGMWSFDGDSLKTATGMWQLEGGSFGMWQLDWGGLTTAVGMRQFERSHWDAAASTSPPHSCHPKKTCGQPITTTQWLSPDGAWSFHPGALEASMGDDTSDRSAAGG